MNAPATNVASRGAPTSHRTIRPTRVARPRPRRYRLRRLTARTEGSMVQFRKSKKVGPFRFTLTNRGVSSNVGAGPFRLSKGADGKLRRTIRVPAAGLYDTKVIGQPPQRRAAQTPRAAAMPSGWHADATDAPAAAPSARRRRVWPWVVGADCPLADHHCEFLRRRAHGCELPISRGVDSDTDGDPSRPSRRPSQ